MSSKNRGQKAPPARSEKATLARSRFVSIFLVASVAISLVQCVSAGPPLLELPPNPPECESTVRQFREDPGRPVDAPPRPWILEIPSTGGLDRQSVTISMVVDETGLPIPGSVDVSGAKGASYERTFREAALKWRLVPAFHGQCRVPARFSYQVSVG